MKSLIEVPLFANIKEMDLPHLLSCLNSRIQIYFKGEYIFLAGRSRPQLGVMMEGQGQIMKENIRGERMIVGNIVKGEIFGETYAFMGIEKIPVSICATEDARVLLLELDKMMNPCSHGCDFHKAIIANMLGILAKKNMMLNEKMAYISPKTIRGRLEAYLYDQVEKKGDFVFDIPFNKNDLADYLCVDRSAMSRELGIMKKKGFIDYEKNRFHVLLERKEEEL